MSQHFLLSPAAKTLSLVKVMRMSDEEARTAFRNIRWADTDGTPYCPECGCVDHYDLKTRQVYKCKGCSKQYSITSGTIFASRKMPVRDILAAIAIFINGAKGYSALQLSRDLSVDYKTAFVLLHKVRESIEAARQHGALGPADILVNNVGFGANPKPIEELSLEEWNTFQSINLTTAFLMSRAVLPGMWARGYGRIVNLASIAGRSISEIFNLHYSTAKAAILGFTRKLAFEEAPNGIGVNCVAPGTVFTDRVRTRYEVLPAEDQRVRMEEIPMKRAARPEEIAAGILFLASDDASYVTGACLDVNGGRWMG